MAAPGSVFGRYRIVARLGAGAMGEVYRAHDPRLRRDVAIKILAPHRSDDPSAVARIVHESQLVASLDHPAIVTIHDVGEQDGRFYFVTELLEGETLRERLSRGRLNPREAIDFAATIATALAAAHARGIVHRDLKPENIFCVGTGGLKVLDFGVAKFVAPLDAVTAAPPTFVTEGQPQIGTPAYMAPEQLEGRAIDHRVDHFAFGVVVYEMLAGQRPFRGATSAEVAAAILRDEPAHLSRVRGDVPAPFARLVARCLSKNADDRYASTTDLAHAIADMRADLSLAIAPAVGSPVRRRPLIWLAAVGVVAAVAIGLALLSAPAPSAVVPVNRTASRAVVVLPFTVIGDAEPYLADGVTEAVTRELGHIEGARVIASSAAFAYRGRTDDVSTIGRELGVEVLVRGSLQRAGERLRINAALVNTADSTTVWSEQYTRSADDVLAVQDDIAWQVAAKLAATIGLAAPPRPAMTPRTTPDAYDAFLRGKSLMRVGSSEFVRGIAELERSVQLDPNFALARATLASAYTQQFFYNATDPQIERKAFVEIQKALALNPDLAEAYLARAQLTWNLRNGFPHERAVADLRRAIANNPNLVEAYVEIGKVYYHLGLTDKAIAAMEEGLKLDPRAGARILVSRIDAGQVAQVTEELERNPHWAPRTRATVLIFLRRTDEAIAALAPRGFSQEEITQMEMNDLANLAQLLARKGQRAEAGRVLALAIPAAANPTGLSDTHHAQFAIGCAYALLGDGDRAIEWITKAAAEGYPSYPRFSSEPDLAGLKGRADFDALLDRLRRDHARWLTSL